MDKNPAGRVLRVDSSARGDASLSRALTDTLVQRLLDTGHASDVITRDVARGLGSVDTTWVDAAWIEANFTPEDDRSAAQRERLTLSEMLVEELFAADTLVIGVPIYNFGIPASLKAWVDLVARARRTFRYTEDGPEGLLGGRAAYLIVTSGGTVLDSEIDFATPYLRHVLGFVGIDDITVIAADRTVARGEEAGETARRQIESLFSTRAA